MGGVGMAKLECELQGDFSLILSQLEDEIINGSISASLEEKRKRLEELENYDALGKQTEKKLKISTDHLCRLCTDLSEIRKKHRWSL